MPVVHLGCSGFTYPHWRGPFYPEGLSQRRWLAHYCAHFASVELNGGKILKTRHSIGPHGFRAIVLDSEGNRIALHSMT